MSKDEIQMCQGIDEAELCKTCERKNQRVSFQRSYYFPPIDIKTGKCQHYWASTDWQDPNRDATVGQNGNVGYEGDCI